MKICIVGCGRMGGERAQAAKQLGEEVVAVCDVEPERARKLAQRFEGCIAFDDISKLDWSKVDAILICTPPVARGPVEHQAVQAGVPFFVEKPIGRSANQVRYVLDAMN